MASNRLNYRFIREEDKEDYAEFLYDAKVTNPAGFLPAIDEATFEVVFGNMLKNQVISIIYEGKAIGYVSLYPEVIEEMPEAKCCGIGFLLNQKYHRLGLATEMLNYFIMILKGNFDYIVCDAFIENEASNHLIQKCGFQYIEDYTMYFPGLCQEKTCHSYRY